MYDYHGQCDLIYTTCPKFNHNKGLHMHLRTEFVKPMNWSTISSMVVKIGEDVFEVENTGTYYLNGKPSATLTDTTSLSGHNLRQVIIKEGTRTVYTIELKDNVKIKDQG